MKNTNRSILHKDGISYISPFILVTSCFALRGLANDITNPMAKAFSKIFRMSVTGGVLVQVASYGGYFAMALPAAMFIRKYSYKAGILLGLGLYALGTLLPFLAKMIGDYYPLLLAHFILTCGFSFPETSANPYILSMGMEETTAQRLNLTQSFNPMRSLLGVYVAMNFVQACLNPMDTVERSQLSPPGLEVLKESDLSISIASCPIIGLVVLAMLFLIRAVEMPKNGDRNHDIDFMPTLKRTFKVHHYRGGVIAQFFYVGTRIMRWTFAIRYGTRLSMSQEMEEKVAEVLPQEYNIIAMIIFRMNRLVYTFILRYLNPGIFLKILATAGDAFTLDVIFLQSIQGLCCLVAVSICILLMSSTVYGIAPRGSGNDAKSGAVGLIMTILGGSVLPPSQTYTIDQHTLLGMPAVNLSFILPFIYSIAITIYGHRTHACVEKIKATRK